MHTCTVVPGYTFAAHISGTSLLKMLLNIVSNASDITTSPFRAFFRSLREECITLSRRLYRMTSWTRTVFIDSVYLTGYFSIMSANGRGLGTLPIIFCSISSTACTGQGNEYMKVLTLSRRNRSSRQCYNTKFNTRAVTVNEQDQNANLPRPQVDLSKIHLFLVLLHNIVL